MSARSCWHSRICRILRSRAHEGGGENPPPARQEAGSKAPGKAPEERTGRETENHGFGRENTMKNTLGDLNNHLFEQLERLNDDDLTEEELQREIRKSDAMVRVSEQIIQNGQLALRTMQYMDSYGLSSKGHKVPPMLALKELV